MATIENRKNDDGTTTYRVKIRLKGFEPVTESFSRKTDAKEWAQKTESAMREGRYFPERKAAKRVMHELIDRYIRDNIPLKKSGPKVKTYLLWWRSKIGNLAVLAVTPDVVAQHRATLLSEKIKRSHNSPGEATEQRTGATVNRYLAALSHVFTVSIKEWGWVTANPLKRVTRYKESPGIVRWLEEDELARWNTELAAEPLWFRTFAHTAFSAMRLGEVLGLTRADLALDMQLAFLEETKNGERRGVALPSEAVEHLRLLLKEQGDKPRDTKIFPPYTSFRKRWERFIKRADIKRFRFHDMRHTAASYHAMSGASNRDLQDLLGHKSPIMSRRYAHLSGKHLVRAVSRMERRFLGQGTPKEGGAGRRFRFTRTARPT